MAAIPKAGAASAIPTSFLAMIIIPLALLLILFPFRILWYAELVIFFAISFLYNGLITGLAVAINGFVFIIVGAFAAAIDVVMMSVAFWINLIIVNPMNTILQVLFAGAGLAGLPIPQLDQLKFPSAVAMLPAMTITPQLYYINLLDFLGPFPVVDVFHILLPMFIEFWEGLRHALGGF